MVMQVPLTLSTIFVTAAGTCTVTVPVNPQFYTSLFKLGQDIAN